MFHIYKEPVSDYSDVAYCGHIMVRGAFMKEEIARRWANHGYRVCKTCQKAAAAQARREEHD